MNALIKKWVILFTVILFQSNLNCARFHKTDLVFIEYIQKFEEEIKVKITIPIVFMSNEKYAGWCKVYSNGYKLIEIDYEFWQASNYYGKEQLIYHELGHCALNREHINILVLNPITNRKIPASIMYESAFGENWYYEQYRHKYIEELKDSKKTFNF